MSGSAANGGGLYLAGGSFNMNGGSVAGATASQNGGGVYVAGGTYTFKKGSIVRNTAVGNGGGVYHGGGTFSMTTDKGATSCGVIGGSAENGNTADKGGGIFVADGQKPSFNDGASKTLEISWNHARTEGGGIAVGGSGAQLTFENAVKVRNNTMGDDRVLCNVYLDLDSNTIIKNNSLDPTSYIGVYVKDSQQEAHGLPGMPFGTYTGTNEQNLDVYHNDRSRYLTGTKGSGNLVVWSSFVCKITDGAGTLLYKDANGTPAVYGVLESRASGAFNTLFQTNHGLYSKNESGEFSKYDGTSFQVQMLTGNYVFEKDQQISLKGGPSNRKIVLTTASKQPDECGFSYTGDERFDAVITRKENFQWAMISIQQNSNWELTFRNIVIDGGGYATTNEGGGGGLLRVDGNNTVILDSGAIFRNSSMTGNGKSGGAVHLNGGDSKLIMNPGSLITNCSAAINGGGVSLGNGTFTMNGGEISGCTANNGGGVWMNNASKFYMNGGSITENNATSNGGGIALSSNNDGSRIYFSGLCNVTGNTLNGATRCNVQLNRDSNAIINAQNLNVKSEIGIYTAGNEATTSTIAYKHGIEGKPFGTWTVSWTEDAAPYCFVNDRNTNLRGSQKGNTDRNIYWMINYLLTVRLNVDSALTADHSKQFSFKVTINDQSVKGRTYSNQRFDSNSSTTVNVTDDNYVTIHFPDAMKDKEYIVEVTQQDGFDAEVEQNEVTKPASQETYSITGHLAENASSGSGESVINVRYTRKTANLTIEKAVNTKNDSDKSTSFPFTLTLENPVNVTKYPSINQASSVQEVSFDSVNSQYVLHFELKDGESLTIQNLPVTLRYTVTEGRDFPNAKLVRTSSIKDTIEASGTSRTGTIGENKTATGPHTTIRFLNSFLEIVCKITNRSNVLLHYNEPGGALVPAVFDRLEDAFAKVNSGSLKTANGGSVSGLLYIKMVVPQYEMSGPATLNAGRTVTLTTAGVNDRDDFPYNQGINDGNGNIAAVLRGFDGESMILDKGMLTIDAITLDGAKETYHAEQNGGIVQTSGAVRLTVNDSATLRNSASTADGGAIWMDSGASLVMYGKIDGCDARNGGGVYAKDGFSSIIMTGTNQKPAVIQNCSATRVDGDGGYGGAVYAGSGSAGSSVSINATANLTGNKAEGGRGGAIYSKTSLTMRGIVGGTEPGMGNSAAEGGGIYMDVGENTMFTMYSTAKILGNNASCGGGLYTKAAARIVDGSLTDNTASYGGAVYCDGSLRMQGGIVTGNSAIDSGGAIYVVTEKTFEMSGGSITGNTSDGGAVSTGPMSVLSFSGNSRVQGNTRNSGGDANVFLGFDSNTIIQSSGLGRDAWIGVYVEDGENDSLFNAHGIAARNFGTYTGANTKTARLESFHNDRISELSGAAGELSEGNVLIMWQGEDLILQVRIWEGSIQGSPRTIPNASFTLKNL
ncbi:MAG: hypothetical protein E7298_14325, partial [Lachnospiraceae bacterium]|nr:hypothetical protein [Lachnospiraceae bacterium]